MGIETAYYMVNWEVLKGGVAETGSLEFFFDAIDDDEEESGDDSWKEWVKLPAYDLWENWRAAESLKAELQQSAELKKWEQYDLLLKWLSFLAVIPDIEEDRFLPCGDLGPPSSLHTEYLGAINPVSLKKLSKAGDLLGANLSTLEEIIDVAEIDSQSSYLPKLPRIIRQYKLLITETDSWGFGILITAS